jgi:hypothetical protein
VSDAKGKSPALGSVAAVVAGSVVGIVLSIGTDAVMHASGIFPPNGKPMSNGLFGLALGYRVVYGLVGSYTIAWLSRERPMRNALIGGAIGFVASTVGAVVTWNKGAEFGPHWYPLALIASTLPSAWLGAKLYLARGAEPSKARARSRWGA